MHHIMRTKKSLLWLLAFAWLVVAGCRREPAPERTITVSFQVGSLLKSTATTEEDQITDILLFGADAQGAVQITQSIPPSGGQLTIPGTVTALYAIANPTDALEAENPTTVADLQALTAGYPAAPAAPFPMSGMATVSGGAVGITLVRCVAKVELTGNANFQMESVTVHTASTGYVFAPAAWAVPTASTWVDHTYTCEDAAPVVIYLAEHESNAPATFTVTGRLLDQPAHLQLITTDPFSITENNHPVDIKRNTSYTWNVDFGWED
jgi:hypothetical protein